MKRNGDIRSLFQKAAKKAAAINAPPDENIVEEQNQEEDRVQVEEIADHLPSPLLASPPPPASKPPAYDINRLPYDPGERLPIEDYPVNDQDAIRRAYITKGHIKAAQERYIGFMNPKVAIDYNIDKWSEEELRLYKKRLTYSLRCIKFLLHQGLTFHGHDESEESSNRGNFIELLKFLAGNSEEVNKYVLNNAPDDTTSLSLKKAIEVLLVSNGLSMQQIRGQVLVAIAKGNIDCKTFFDQRRDQDILNAISLVNVAKSRMQELMSNGWDNFLQNVTSFCIKHGVEVPAVDGAYVSYEKSARQELDNRFDEINMELLSCMSAFSPSNSFASFDARKVRRLAEFYPKDFSNNDLLKLELQLDNYIDDMRQDASFQGLDNIVDLSVKLVEIKRHKVYDMMYLLLKLILLLLVATASVERVFSALVIVKTKSRNKIGDTILDDCLVTFIERDIFFQVNEDDIMETFMSLRKRRINK
ncbi:uncharacterized protein [Miscanthus floridulus]|uniref:uncharacterized protein n=1 Tax=Miscanthus floridulus TaxID=154761 RepID=UPI0034584568